MFGCACMCAHVYGSQRLFLNCSYFTKSGTHQFCFSGQGEAPGSLLPHCAWITGTQYHFTGAWQTLYHLSHHSSPGMYLVQVYEQYTVTYSAYVVQSPSLSKEPAIKIPYCQVLFLVAFTEQLPTQVHRKLSCQKLFCCLSVGHHLEKVKDTQVHCSPTASQDLASLYISLVSSVLSVAQESKGLPRNFVVLSRWLHELHNCILGTENNGCLCPHE